MDVDVVPQHDFHELPGDDLIDYDDDMVDSKEAHAQPQPHLETTEPGDDIIDVDAVMAEHIATNELPNALSTENLTQPDEDMYEQILEESDSMGATVVGLDVAVESAPATSLEDNVASTIKSNDEEATGEKNDEPLNEIDYNFPDDLDASKTEPVTNSNQEGGDERTVDELASTSEQHRVADDSRQLMEDEAGKDPIVIEDESEIHWEDEGGEGVEVLEEGRSDPTVPEKNNQPYKDDELRSNDTGEEGHTGEHEALQSNTDGDDNWEGNNANEFLTMAEVEGHDTLADASPGESIDRPETYGSEGIEYPQITVQYKGDEYPLFSSSSAGFFSELSVLDESMDKLMAGFRAELASELSSDDELVFQVDELGLEIAEAHVQGALSAITLRQILDIFDLLVKNQDPDSTRVLYTYLFTKPSTNKRFEYLVESAAAGKGLDEVVHLFQSPMPNNGDDESGGGGGGKSGNAPAAEPAGEGLDDKNYEETEGSINDSIERIEEEYLEKEGIDSARDGLEQGTSADADEQAQEFEDNMSQNEPADFMPQSINGESNIDELNVNEETAEPTESETSPFLALDLEETTELDVVDLENENTDGATGNAFADAAVTTTSTTNTLQDDDEASAALMAETLEPETTFDVNEFSAEQEDLDEIDWRDDADKELEDEASNSGVGKRPHNEAELGSEDEKDAKRLRS